MKIILETSISNFDFWAGAKDNAKELTNKQFDNLESILEDIYPNGITDTQLNDLFWFDFDWIKEQLGIDEEEEEE